MKHAIRYTLLIIMGTLLLGGCSKDRVIPDEELSVIAREMFLANAYVNVNKVNTDSLDIYTPILEKHGYTQDDFFFTLANFQKRKSARLGDVINATILDMESLSDGYQEKVRNMKFIDSLAKASCAKEVLVMEDIKVDRMKDTAKLRLSIPIVDKGEYRVEYIYSIDTLDKNIRLQSEHLTHDIKGKRLSLLRNNLSAGGENKKYTTTIVPKKGASKYTLVLADYKHRENEPHIEFHNVRVTYYPPIEEALEWMDYSLRIQPAMYLDDSVRVRNYNNVPVPTLPTDTLWVPLDSMELALADNHILFADSLTTKADELQEELDGLAKRKETDERKAKMEQLRGEIEELRAQAESRIQSADSLETLVMGHPRSRE